MPLQKQDPFSTFTKQEWSKLVIPLKDYQELINYLNDNAFL